MHDNDCCNHDGPHRSPFGLYGPYDPVHHHHHKHPPYLVDRCAEQCDDQLPLFSQVGRGLRGDSYKVEVQKDSLTETILEGLYVDEHTGALVSDWISENINGGHLSYGYNLRPWTDPQTFTISFRYVRPGRNADEDGTVWSWTTPAIPYSYNDYNGNIGSGVATLYLKKTTEDPWNWRIHEKLVYPDGMDHNSMNAPDPLEPYTVNLEYGIGGDIDAPNIDDLAKVLGITVDNIRNIILNSPDPLETIPDINLKKYIDRMDKQLLDSIDNIDVVSTDTKLLTVSKQNDTSRIPRELKFTLTPKNYIAGSGMKIEPDGDRYKITNNIMGGPGISLENGPNNSIKISNTQVDARWELLTPNVDFEWRHHNWYYFGVVAADYVWGDQHHPNESEVSKQPPNIEVIISRDPDGNPTGAEVYVHQRPVDSMATRRGNPDPMDNSAMLQCTENLIRTIEINKYSGDGVNDPWHEWPVGSGIMVPSHELIGTETVNLGQIRHALLLVNAPLSSIGSFKFKGDYAFLNDMRIISGSVVNTEHTFNVRGRGSVSNPVPLSDPNTVWRMYGGSTEPAWWVNKINYSANDRYNDILKDGRGVKYLNFAIGLGQLPDGFNGDFSTGQWKFVSGPEEGQRISAICIRSHANFGLRFSMTS